MSDSAAMRRARARPGLAYAIGVALIVTVSILSLPLLVKSIWPSLAIHEYPPVYGLVAAATAFSAFVIWGGVQATFLRGREPSWTYLAVLMVIALIVDLPAVYAAKREIFSEDQAFSVPHRTVVGELQAIVDAFTKPALKAPVAKVFVAPSSPASRAWKDLVNGLGADSRAFQGEIRALQIDGELAPNRLTTAEAAATARAKMKQARQLIDKYRAATAPRFAAAAKAGAPQDEARDLKTRRAALWAREQAIIEEADGMIVFLDKRRGSWKLGPGNSIVFGSKPDLVSYRGRQQRLRTLAIEERSQQVYDQQYARQVMQQLVSEAGR